VKIGLVLGAGGVQGGAWLTGGLDALAGETGWDPASAEIVVGTSAGSMMAALLTGGVPPWFMVAHSAGETFPGLVDASGRPAAEADRAGGASFKPQLWPPPRWPGSWRLGTRSLLRPNAHTPAAVLSGWLPSGLVSTEPLRAQVRRVVPEGWAPHPNLWIVACDYETGRRVAFGREGSPEAELPDAVAASCAIPGFYRPVRIGERSYVDGGIYSASNLDIVRNSDLDLVICLNPTSSLHPIRAIDPREWSTLLFRRATGRRLGSEAKTLHARGIPTVLVQPLGDDLEAMSRNLMSTRNRNRVIEVARRTVAAQLREPVNAKLIAGLPQGRPEMVRRPELPPEQWPELIGLPTA
jgi:NTE family protein